MAEGKNLVGVDIGASSIKVVQLKEARKKLQIIRSGFAELPPQTIIDGHVMNAGAVTEALGKIFTDSKIQQRDVSIGVYGQSVIVRKITVPMMTPGELDEQIHWEAEQHIPFDIKLMSIDYEVLRRRPEAGQMDLLLVAAKKDEISDYASILKRGQAQAGGGRHQRLHRPEHLRAPVRPSAGRQHRPAQRGGGGLVAQHRGQGRERLHARDHQRRQHDHRGDPQGPVVLVRAGRGLQDGRRSDADRPAGGRPDHQPGRARAWPARSSAPSTSTSPPAASRRSAASTSRAAAPTSRR